MAARDNGEGEDDGPGRTIYTPLDGDEWCAEDDDAEDEYPRHQPREPEALEDLGHLLEEVRTLDLLLRRAPRHVVAEQMRQDRLRERNRETAEEEEAVERKEGLVRCTRMLAL